MQRLNILESTPEFDRVCGFCDCIMPVGHTRLIVGGILEGQAYCSPSCANGVHKHRPRLFENGVNSLQKVLVDGMDCLPG